MDSGVKGSSRWGDKLPKVEEAKEGRSTSCPKHYDVWVVFTVGPQLFDAPQNMGGNGQTGLLSPGGG